MTPSTMNRSRRLLALGAAALVLSTSACSSGGSDQKADTKSASATTAAVSGGSTEDTTAADATANEGGDEASTATTAPKDDAEPIGTSTGQLRADPNDATLVPLQLDVLSVERIEGETVEVRFRITNTDDTATFEPWTELGDASIASGTYDVGGLALLDRPNDKKYLTLFDSDDVCLCTGGTGQVAIAPGESADFYADVTAPPESVKTIDVSVPGFQPVNGLEIS